MELKLPKRLTKQRLRVIDGLIAEHLFGWKWFSSGGASFLIPPFGQEEAISFRVHWTPGLKSRTSYDDKLHTCKKCYDIERRYPQTYERWALPHYTTDPAAAFVVLINCGRTEEVTFYQRLDEEYKNQWFAFNKGCCIHGLAGTPTLAVCLFALNLKKVKLPWK